MYGPVLLALRGRNAWQRRSEHGHEPHRFPLRARHFSPLVTYWSRLATRLVDQYTQELTGGFDDMQPKEGEPDVAETATITKPPG